MCCFLKLNVLLRSNLQCEREGAQVEPSQHNRWQGGQVGQGTLEGRGAEQSAVEAAAGDLEGTARVGRPRRAKTSDKAEDQDQGGTKDRWDKQGDARCAVPTDERTGKVPPTSERGTCN